MTRWLISTCARSRFHCPNSLDELCARVVTGEWAKENTYFLLHSLGLAMPSLLIRLATVHDINSIVRIRLTTLTDEEIAGFTAPEFTKTYTSNRELRKIWGKGNQMKGGLKYFLQRRIILSLVSSFTGLSMIMAA